MGKRTTGLVVAGIWALTGCGQTTDETRSGDGAGGSAASAGGGTNNPAQGGARSGGANGTSFGGSFAGVGGANGGTAGASGSGGSPSAGGSAAVCTPTAHERTTPSTLSRTFSDIAPGLAGVYLIDDVFRESADCSTMCSSGNSLGGSSLGYRYVTVQANPSTNQLVITGCESPQSCANSMAIHLAVGAVASVVSDQILSGQQTKVENPQGQVCTGASLDTWLIERSATSVRIDLESVNVTFPATYDQSSGLYGCGSGDVDNLAIGKPCNELLVIDAARVQ